MSLKDLFNRLQSSRDRLDSKLSAVEASEAAITGLRLGVRNTENDILSEWGRRQSFERRVAALAVDVKRRMEAARQLRPALAGFPGVVALIDDHEAAATRFLAAHKANDARGALSAAGDMAHVESALRVQSFDMLSDLRESRLAIAAEIDKNRREVGVIFDQPESERT